MKSKENLVFLGMMGSGKSSIGTLLAKRLNLKFIDIDKQIEIESGLTIRKIFETKNEDFFRKLEEKITLRVLKLKSTVIALGGGAFINRNIKKEVIKNHLSFWLNWDSKILISRIKNSKKRPVAFEASEDELIDLIKYRSCFYSKALYEIKCDNLSKNEIINEIIKIYETN